MWILVSPPLPGFPVLPEHATRATNAGVPAPHALSPAPTLVTLPSPEATDQVGGVLGSNPGPAASWLCTPGQNT